MNFLFSKLFPPKLLPEVVRCYLQRMPGTIEVAWKREDGLIVGRVKFGPNENDYFWTQAKMAKEFIYMVNDALFISLDMKSEYIPFMHRAISFLPNAEQLKSLNDGSIKEGSFDVVAKQGQQALTA